MKILSIDTASNICGVSILENVDLICTLDTDTGRTHSENLMPMIDKALNTSNLKVKDIDLIVCDIGPGSFTGIRIGIATSKAFVDSLGLNCIGINSLESLAYNIKDVLAEHECVCSMIDCKNSNCYFSLYQKKNNSLQTLIEPQADSVDSCLAILSSYISDNFDTCSVTFIGDGSKIYKNDILNIFSNAKFATDSQNALNSYSLALAGINKYNSRIEADELLPLYLKKPQAERLLQEKNTSK